MNVENIKSDILRSEIKLKLEMFERDITIIGGILVLTPLIILLISSLFNSSIIFILIPILAILCILFTTILDRELEDIMKLLTGYKFNIVEKYRKFRNRLYSVFKSLDDFEKILFKYEICNRITGNLSRVEPYSTLYDMCIIPSKSRDSIDVIYVENYRKFIIKEIRRFVVRVSSLFMMCMICEGILMPILYVVLVKSLNINPNITSLIVGILPTLVVYFYLGYRMFRIFENKIGIERSFIGIFKKFAIFFSIIVMFFIFIVLIFL